MPTIEITAMQTVYYKKTMDLPQDEYEQLMELRDEGDWLEREVMQWMADGDAGFDDEDIVETAQVEDLLIITVSK